MRLATSYSRRGKASTTIGAGELNYCVRYGNRCGLSAIAARLTLYKLFFLINVINVKDKLYLGNTF